MMNRLEEAFSEFSCARRAATALVAGQSEEALASNPSPGKWSVGEVLDHLLLIEAYQRQQIMELIARAKSGRPTVVVRTFSELDISLGPIPKPMMSWFELPLLLVGPFIPNVIRETMMKNRWGGAKHPSFATPRPGLSGESLRRRLRSSLSCTKATLSADPTLPFERMYLHHPLLGLVNVPGILRYLSRHEQGHSGQILEAMASVRAL